MGDLLPFGNAIGMVQRRAISHALLLVGSNAYKTHLHYDTLWQKY